MDPFIHSTNYIEHIYGIKTENKINVSPIFPEFKIVENTS